MVLRSFWMLLASFLFAVMAVCIKLGAANYGFPELVFYRSIFGVLFCAATLRQKRLTIRTSHPWRHVVRCAIGTTSITLGVIALGQLPIATAQTLNYTAPLAFGLILSAEMLFHKEKPDWPVLAAVAAGFAGVLLILRPDFPAELWSAALIGLLAGLTGGGADFMIRNLSLCGEPKERIIFYFTLCGTVAGFLGSLWTGFSPHTFEGVLTLLGIGLSATLAQFALTLAWAQGHPLVNCVYQYSGILFAILFGLALFGESVDGLTLLGMAVVALSGLAASVLILRQSR